MARAFDSASSQDLSSNGTSISVNVPYAMCIWFNADGLATQNIFDLRVIGSEQRLLIRIDGALRFRDEVAGANADTSTTYSAGVWSHAAGIAATDTDRRCLLDNSGKAISTTSGVGSWAPNAIFLASRESSVQYYDGLLAEAALFDLSVLPGATASDKADGFEANILPSLAAGFSPLLFGFCLAFYAPLIRDADRDIVGGLSLTANGTPTVADHTRIFYPAPKMIAVPTAAGGATINESLGIGKVGNIFVPGIELSAASSLSIGEALNIVVSNVQASIADTMSVARIDNILTSSSIPQFARPISDASIGNWTDELDGTTDIYQSIDETTPDDDDYVKSESDPSSSPYVVQITSLDDPSSSVGHIVRYRYHKPSGIAAQIDLTVQIREGYVSEASPGTLIAEHIYTDIPDTATEAEEVLTESETDSITDYTDLYLRFVANAP